MTVAKISCDASSTPNITVLEYVKDPAMIPEILDRIFQESPLKITNMQVSEMFFPRGSNPGASLGLIKMDMDINNQTGKMNLAIDNISIPAGMEKDWEGNPFPPQDLNGKYVTKPKQQTRR